MLIGRYPVCFMLCVSSCFHALLCFYMYQIQSVRNPPSSFCKVTVSCELCASTQVALNNDIKLVYDYILLVPTALDPTPKVIFGYKLNHTYYNSPGLAFSARPSTAAMSSSIFSFSEAQAGLGILYRGPQLA